MTSWPLKNLGPPDTCSLTLLFIVQFKTPAGSTARRINAHTDSKLIQNLSQRHFLTLFSHRVCSPCCFPVGLSFLYFILQSKGCISLGIKQSMNLGKIMIEKIYLAFCFPECLLLFPFLAQHPPKALRMWFKLIIPPGSGEVTKMRIPCPKKFKHSCLWWGRRQLGSKEGGPIVIN